MCILSIQSHVAYGHVGNAVATFALQRLELEVWPVMTVQLSNHTGYPSWRGRRFDAAHIGDVAQGLEELGALASCRAVLSGYLGSAEVGAEVLAALERTRRANADALYLCDPVMGDQGRGLYVPEAVARFYREQAVPRATIVAPNLFELAQLTGGPVETRDAALAAARSLRTRGPDVVLVTSMRFQDTPAGSVALLVVSDSGAWQVETPWLDMDPPANGAGDLLAALFLGHYLRADRGPERTARAAAKAASATYAIVEATHRAGARELQLIAAQDKLLQPDQAFSATPVG